MELTELTVYVETGETDQSAAQEVYDVLGTYLPAGITLVEVETAAEHERRRQPHAATAAGDATGTPAGAQPAESTTARGINLSARFRPDEEAARDLIGRIIAAHDRLEIPADDTPMFGATWDPSRYGADSTVKRLVRYAADNGAIASPEGMGLEFVYVPGDQDAPDHYYFTVTIGHTFTEKVTLSSCWSEMRKIVDHETGADAAMSILGEAVARANRELDRLAGLIADNTTHITPTVA